MVADPEQINDRPQMHIYALFVSLRANRSIQMCLYFRSQMHDIIQIYKLLGDCKILLQSVQSLTR